MGAAQLASRSAAKPVTVIAVSLEAFICMAAELNEEPRLTPAPSGVGDDLPGGVTDEALLDHLATYLVRYKLPQSFEYVTGPLRDDAGKVRRSALRSARM